MQIGVNVTPKKHLGLCLRKGKWNTGLWTVFTHTETRAITLLGESSHRIKQVR